MRIGILTLLLLTGCSTYRSTHKLRFNDDVETDMFACVPDPNSNDKRDKLCVDIATYNAMVIRSFMEKMSEPGEGKN